MSARQHQLKQQRHEQKRQRKRQAVRRPGGRPEERRASFAPGHLGRKTRITLAIVTILLALAFAFGTPAVSTLLS